jgi:hypothetical protein
VRRSRLFLPALVLAAAAACERGPGLRRVFSRRAVVESEIALLRQQVRAAEQGGLFDKSRLVVALSESVASRIVRLALPREEVVLGRYRVRLETVDVRFRDERGSLRFDGRIASTAGTEPGFAADLALFGTVERVDIDRATGVLACEVAIVRSELTRIDAGAESPAARLLIEEMGRQGAGILQALAFPIVVPVRLEREIALKSVAGPGPVTLRPASLPLHLTVTDATAHGGRLWVSVEVGAGRALEPRGAP